ncbi:MAG: U32 family peptidase [Oscillospiraceae bacterium]|jgi:putative protease|nr:U32 family peptidase [Oscillospiraceae bacterium]
MEIIKKQHPITNSVLKQDVSKIELLSPAGDMERLVAAVQYGADAVYLGGTQFGMRTAPPNFNFDSLSEAVQFAHNNAVRVYLTCNALPHNNEIADFPAFITQAADCGIDAVIAADFGVISLIKKYAPGLEIHASTQMGIVNSATALALFDMGVRRIIVARELSLSEIAQIRAQTPKELEIEAFVHGAMCVSFSGRCLLSQYFTGRDANKGECAQPCRWEYRQVTDGSWSGPVVDITEDGGGTYIMNARDLCMIEHIDKLASAGINSFKIEGRAKSAYYVSVITNAYRAALDYFYRENTLDGMPEWIFKEVLQVSHREYSTGFYFGAPTQNYKSGGYIKGCDVVGIVDCCRDGILYGTQRNKFLSGDELEILAPNSSPITVKIDRLFNEKGDEIQSAPHAMMKFSFPCESEFPKGAAMRNLYRPPKA